MPNRILRDSALESDKIAAVSEQAEVLFYRLLMLADDFGRFDGRVPVIRGRAFVLRPQVTDVVIEARLSELEQSGLIHRYMAGGKPYLEIPRFGQRKRAEKSKFPNPPPQCADECHTDDGQLSDSRTPRARGRSSYSKAEAETVPVGAPPAPQGDPVDLKSQVFGPCLDWLAEQASKPKDRLRPLVGKWCRDHGDAAVIAAMTRAAKEAPVDPVAWIERGFVGRMSGHGPPGMVDTARKLIEDFHRAENGHFRQDDSGADETQGGHPSALPRG
jgi:hypothetical protein